MKFRFINEPVSTSVKQIEIRHPGRDSKASSPDTLPSPLTSVFMRANSKLSLAGGKPRGLAASTLKIVMIFSTRPAGELTVMVTPFAGAALEKARACFSHPLTFVRLMIKPSTT